MRRFFARNLLFIIAVNLLIKPVWIFLIDRNVQNRVGHEEYGIYQALFNLGLVFQILLDFGINNYNSRTLAQFPGKIKTLFPVMLTARVLLSVLYLLIVCLIGLAFGYSGRELGLLFGVLLIQSLNSIMLFVRSNASGLHKFKADGVLSVVDRSLMIIVCGALLFLPQTAEAFRIEWFIQAQIVCYGLAFLIGIILLKKIARVPLRFSLNAPKVLSIVRQSMPYAVLIFLMSIYTRADMMLVERLSGEAGKEQAGIYAAAYRLLDVGNMFGLMVATMLLPVFGRMLAKKEAVRPIVELCVNLLLPASLLVAISGIFFSDHIMQALYSHATETDGIVFSLLMLAFPAFSLSNIYSTLLTANGSLKLLNRIALTGVVINLGLNFLLIPQYAAIGAAATAFVTQTVLALAFILFSQRQTSLEKRPLWAFRFIGYALLLVIGGFVVQMLPLFWVIQLIILAALGGVLMLLFRFIRINAVKQVF